MIDIRRNIEPRYAANTEGFADTPARALLFSGEGYLAKVTWLRYAASLYQMRMPI